MSSLNDFGSQTFSAHLKLNVYFCLIRGRNRRTSEPAKSVEDLDKEMDEYLSSR